ncbi:1-phosphatidylinositol phosphodiesterase [Pedobacter sp. Bi27]|uniref:phosphatidylinositol-specific phospholipase C n=1 Tax=unclassified Pedobacter TaxID=2628915 RepID=UPI001E07C1FD|nr:MULTISPECIES: phosphatidylinositol-specific phospholipase C [unclassified Pedobacter]CAH0311104.1 1-phosphatidylinositol phosphodiesterase [Pedobacter sp. Bi36]CAH0317321.1 1-phosphatidylinositol phosphodiesterase [Pedobacter sp. Bi126]CAH0318813.1 1-phosphatidylinositol phosphodiesterase [Pedobacter sp. Bi27]
MRKLQLPLIVALVLTFSACKKEEQPKGNFSNSNLKSTANANAQLLSFSLNSWMSVVADQTSIAAISIPGTHDSGATQEQVAGTAKCQNLSITDQLNAGVRYLDIRCRHIDNAFAIHHGAIYQNLNFNDVLNACINFLNSHPTETIIMSVKEEHTPTNNTRSFEQTFDAYVQQNPAKWDLGNNIPTLGSIRGKIRLLRRFSGSSPKGIDATAWADNTTFDINNAATLKVQDFYNVNDVNTKWTKVETLLNEAKNDASNRLYLNYASGYKAGIFSIPSITTVSNFINPKINTFFTNNTHGKFGIIPLDFVDSGRSQLIINTNF